MTENIDSYLSRLTKKVGDLKDSCSRIQMGQQITCKTVQSNLDIINTRWASFGDRGEHDRRQRDRVLSSQLKQSALHPGLFGNAVDIGL